MPPFMLQAVTASQRPLGTSGGCRPGPDIVAPETDVLPAEGRDLVEGRGRLRPSNATLPKDLAWFDGQISALERR
jgi:hypothetical protein